MTISSEFWRDLAERFEALVDPDGFMQARRARNQGGRPEWRIEVPGDIYQGLRAKCTTLIVRGGMALGNFGDPLSLWMDEMVARGISVYADGDSTVILPLRDACSILCRTLEVESLKIEQARDAAAFAEADELAPAKGGPTLAVERATLRDRYLDSFPEKIKILDICWAANQYYREWTRWVGGKLKNGSTADRAFRAIMTSGKRPGEYRSETRPKGRK